MNKNRRWWSREKEKEYQLLRKEGQIPHRVDRYDRAGEMKKKAEVANNGPSSDGGMVTRAKNMAAISDTNNIVVTGLQFGQGPVKQVLETTAGIDPEGKFDKGFLQVMSVVTENAIANLAHGERIGEGVEYTTGFDEDVPTKKTQEEKDWQTPIPKSLQNAALGKQDS